MLVVTDWQNAVWIRSVSTDNDRHNSGQLFGRACINPLNARMRMRGVQDLSNQHAGKREIVGVLARAGGLASGIDHGNGFADDGEAVAHFAAAIPFFSAWIAALIASYIWL